MSATTSRTEIEALFPQLAQAHADHDADATVEAYAQVARDAGSSSVTCLTLRLLRPVKHSVSQYK